MKYSPTMLITGGASGLGRSLAEQAAAEGYRVAVADIHRTRGEDTCRALAEQNAECFFVECDVRRDEDLRRAVERVLRRWRQLDVMVNNAGVAGAGLFEAIPQDDWQWLFDINVMGTVRGCRAAVSAMKRQRHGHIVNIAAMEALTPAPALSSHNAAKAALVNLSETLRAELAPEGIHVTVVCPPFFRSHLAESLRAPDPVTAARFERLLDGGDTSATLVAKQTLTAIRKRRFLVIPSAEAKADWRLKRWWPERFYRGMEKLAVKFRR